MSTLCYDFKRDKVVEQACDATERRDKLWVFDGLGRDLPISNTVASVDNRDYLLSSARNFQPTCLDECVSRCRSRETITA